MADLVELMEALLDARRKLSAEFARLHKKVLAFAEEDATCKRSMTLPSDSAVMALAYCLAIPGHVPIGP